MRNIFVRRAHYPQPLPSSSGGSGTVKRFASAPASLVNLGPSSGFVSIQTLSFTVGSTSDGVDIEGWVDCIASYNSPAMYNVDIELLVDGVQERTFKQFLPTDGTDNTMSFFLYITAALSGLASGAHTAEIRMRQNLANVGVNIIAEDGQLRTLVYTA